MSIVSIIFYGDVHFKQLLSFQSMFQIYSHVPKWADVILKKAPTDRTDKEIRQIHSMMQGLLAYDKFTRRIQIAMCRSMRFIR